MQIQLDYADASAEESDRLVTEVQGRLNEDTNLSLYKFHVSASPANGAAGAQLVQENHDYRESALIVNVQSDKKVKSPEATLRSLFPLLDVRHNAARSHEPTQLSAFITDEVLKIFLTEQDEISYLLKDTKFATEGLEDGLSSSVKTGLDAKSTRAFKYASTYHLTFSLFTSSASPSTWEIEQALDEIIQPLIDRMSSVYHFTVDTQVQLYASFSPSISGPEYVPSKKEWQLQRSDLSGFINTAEWPLSPSIGAGPTINFVLYVPSEQQSPLVLAETGGNSWLIPQWGGVQIFNPTSKHSERLSVNDLRPAMFTFADQLLSLVGLPPSPPSLSLRISNLTRQRATSLILSASSTLGALARLTLKLKSIAIPDSVAKSVAETIYRLDQACQHMRDGHFQQAFENARIAEAEAEKAFFEPSMVGQVYFPEEHKVAVYVPLLGPMAVPLVISLLKELRKLRERKAKVA